MCRAIVRRCEERSKKFGGCCNSGGHFVSVTLPAARPPDSVAFPLLHSRSPPFLFLILSISLSLSRLASFFLSSLRCSFFRWGFRCNRVPSLQTLPFVFLSTVTHYWHFCPQRSVLSIHLIASTLDQDCLYTYYLIRRIWIFEFAVVTLSTISLNLSRTHTTSGYQNKH